MALERDLLKAAEEADQGRDGGGETLLPLEPSAEVEAAQAAVKKVLDRQPKKKKVRRRIEKPGYDEEDYEEAIDYVFPDDDAAEQNYKLLAAAAAWKKKKNAKAAAAAPG